MKQFFASFALFVLALSALFVMPAPAHATLTITPTRVIFEGRDRFQDVVLINTGNETKTYQLSWKYFRMQETGTPYAGVEGSLTDFDLAEHMVFTPRRVTLPPGGKQKVRLALRRPAEEIPAGDYRAHLEFIGVMEIPEQAPSGGQKGQASAAVNINVGWSIPVMFRVGDSDATAEIEPVQLERSPENGRLKAMVPVRRMGGPFGILGHLFVYHKGLDGSEELVGEISNAHIFPEVDRRVFDVALLKQNLSGGSLRVVMAHYDKNKNLIYDQKTFPVN